MEPSAGQIVGREHLLPVRVYYEDTDFSGVVYHASYLRYFERGRSDFLRVAGVSHTELSGRPEPLAFAVRRMEIDFVRPARVDDALVVRTAFEPLKGARMIARQVIERGGEALVRAVVEAVCIRPDGRPARPPADVIEKMRAIVSPTPRAST
jgi:acyl-CoA thioester hydrolase